MLSCPLWEPEQIQELRFQLLEWNLGVARLLSMSTASAEGTVRGQGPEDKKACPESTVHSQRQERPATVLGASEVRTELLRAAQVQWHLKGGGRGLSRSGNVECPEGGH